MIRPAHEADLLELAQLQGQHPVRDRGIVAPQVAESFGAVLEIVQQQRGPASAQHLHDLLDRTAGDDVLHCLRSFWLQKCAYFTWVHRCLGSRPLTSPTSGYVNGTDPSLWLSARNIDGPRRHAGVAGTTLPAEPRRHV